MARKTFISYKYSESRTLRDRIIGALGDNATFYMGETVESPKLVDLRTEAIKAKLRDMIFGTSVTIVIVSPNMKNSNWIDWEIEYSLKEITRGDRSSSCNGIVGVLAKDNGSYDWIMTETKNTDGCTVKTYKAEKLYDIISKNRFNRKRAEHTCKDCKTFNYLNDSYISFITEDEFLGNCEKYIENAYSKSQEKYEFEIVKEIT